MTQEREWLRNLHQSVDNKISNNRIFGEAIILDYSDKDKIAKIKVLPENKEAYARMLQPFYSSKSGISSSPTKNAHAFIVFSSQKDDIYEDIIVVGYLKDSNNSLTKETDGEKDSNYTSITHANGSKIDLFSDGDTKKHLLQKGFNFVKSEGLDKYDIISNNVSLGEAGLTDEDTKLVTRKHLDINDAQIDELKSLLDSLINQPFLGDLGIPLPIAVRNPASLTAYLQLVTKILTGVIKDNNSNKTSKTRAK